MVSLIIWSYLLLYIKSCSFIVQEKTHLLNQTKIIRLATIAKALAVVSVLTLLLKMMAIGNADNSVQVGG